MLNFAIGIMQNHFSAGYLSFLPIIVVKVAVRMYVISCSVLFFQNGISIQDMGQREERETITGQS